MKPTCVLNGQINENGFNSHGANGVSWCGMTESGNSGGVVCNGVKAGVQWCALV
jgi:hypothetical protein